MTDKVLCPWCGAEMEEEWCKLRRYYARYSCQCGALGPRGGQGKTVEEAIAAAKEIALHRYEPPVKPLTLEEVKRIGENDYVWLEDKMLKSTCCFYGRDSLSEWLKRLGGSYGRTWRCWPRKPTEQEREECGWEGAKE